jgi:tripartite ATP-independent transporter DctM subunit
MLVWVFLIALLLLIFGGMAIAFAMGVTSLIVVVIDRGIGNIPFGIMAQRMVYGVNSFPLLAIPFFLLAGRLMNTAGITDRIFKFCNVLIGHVQGGLGHVNILASMIFAGMSGSAVSDAVGLGQIELKAMRDQGYDDEFSAAITAASSTIGPIIPPSIPMVLYGVLGNVSVGALFIGGIIPGVLMGLFMMVTVSIIAKRRNYPVHERAGFRDVVRATFAALFPLLCPVILIGGIWSGIFTPTEAAAVAVVYSMGLGLILYQELNFRSLIRVLREALDDTSVILFIISAASLYGWLLARYQIPSGIAEKILSLTQEPMVILLLVNGFLLVVGCFMESLAAINILTPILLPLVMKVGIDPLHFGVVMVLNLMIGLLTPPVGMVLFAVQRVSGVPFDRLQRALLIYFIPLLLVLLLITLFPSLVMWLPSTLWRK